MGVVYWVAQKLEFAARVQLVLLIGILMLVLVTGLSIAGGNNSFWTTHYPSNLIPSRNPIRSPLVREDLKLGVERAYIVPMALLSAFPGNDDTKY